jgi:uncharacterized protein (UPF0332 family)
VTPEQKDLLVHARQSLAAAMDLQVGAHYGFAASRAYYAMFYLAEAFLLGRELAFSKHSAVHAAFGRYFAKTGLVPAEFHHYLLSGFEVRLTGDYGRPKQVTREQAAEQIERAEQFIQLAERLIGPIQDEPGKAN